MLTAYWALGEGDASQAVAARRSLLDDSAEVWARRVLDDLALAHPDLGPGFRGYLKGLAL